MSVLVINTTNNRVGFENDFCKKLMLGIDGDNNRLKNAVGYELMNIFDDHELDNGMDVIVVVSHAGNDGSNTYLELGFEDYRLDRPTIFTQFLRRNSKDFILVLCACEALSPEAIVSGIEAPNCRGVISSITPIWKNQCTTIAQVINTAQTSIQSQNDMTSLNSDVRRICAGSPDMLCFEVPRVYEEE